MVNGYYFTYDEKNPIRLIHFILEKVMCWIRKKKKVLKRCCSRFGKKIMKPLTVVNMSPCPMHCNCIMKSSERMKELFPLLQYLL